MKKRVLNSNSISSFGQALPSQTALSSNRVRPIPEKTYRERIITYLDDNGPCAVRAISEGTGINPNAVSVTLHNGKGKVFYQNPQNRNWGLICCR